VERKKIEKEQEKVREEEFKKLQARNSLTSKKISSQLEGKFKKSTTMTKSPKKK
jgi:hypothetical protein